jgi:hypothetical protein
MLRPHFLEGFQITPGQILVDGAALPDLFQLVSTDFLDDFSGGSHDHTVRGDFFPERDKTPRSDQAVGVDLDAVRDDGTHTHEYIGTDLASMKNAAVPDVCVGMKDRGFVGKGVKDAVFLNIRTLSDLYGANISPEDGTGTHIATGVDHHIPYQNGFGMNKCL